jgi:hypothetical protein
LVWVVPLSATKLISRRLTPAHHVSGIRSLSGVGSAVTPLTLSEPYLRYTCTRLYLNTFRPLLTTSPYTLPALQATSQQWFAMTYAGIRHRPFSELPTSAGELLHTPKRIPTFMATVLLSSVSNILLGLCVLAQTQILYANSRIIPHRQYCLPVVAHMGP